MNSMAQSCCTRFPASVAITLTLCSCDGPPSPQDGLRNNTHRYVAANCDFAVRFPSEPRVRNLTHPQLGSYEEAGLVSGEPGIPAMLRTECIPVPDNLARLGGDVGAANMLQQQLNAFAVTGGLENVQISVEQTALGPTGMLRGTKTVGGQPAMYQMRTVAGPHSNINVYVGGAASSFPQPGMMEFLNSIEPASAGAGL